MNRRILCIGAVLWDVIGRAPGRMDKGDDVPGRIRHIPGGVALNVALALARLQPSGQGNVCVLGAVGQDAEGNALMDIATQRGVDCSLLYQSPDLPTDVYMAIEDADGLIAAVADAHSLERAGEAILSPLRDGRLGSEAQPFEGVIVLDGNLTESLLETIAQDPCFAKADLRIVPASPGKVTRLRPLMQMPNACLYLNKIEADTLSGGAHPDASAAARAMVDLGARRVIVTDGARMAADACARETHLATPPQVEIIRVTGAGDTLLAAHIHAERLGTLRGAALERAVAAAALHVSGKDIA